MKELLATLLFCLIPAFVMSAPQSPSPTADDRGRSHWLFSVPFSSVQEKIKKGNEQVFFEFETGQKILLPPSRFWKQFKRKKKKSDELWAFDGKDTGWALVRNNRIIHYLITRSARSVYDTDRVLDETLIRNVKNREEDLLLLVQMMKDDSITYFDISGSQRTIEIDNQPNEERWKRYEALAKDLSIERIDINHITKHDSYVFYVDSQNVWEYAGYSKGLIYTETPVEPLVKNLDYVNFEDFSEYEAYVKIKSNWYIFFEYANLEDIVLSSPKPQWHKQNLIYSDKPVVTIPAAPLPPS